MPVKMMRRITAADAHAPQPGKRLQSAARQRDHQRVVAGQQHIDPDDLADRNPERGLLHFGLKLGKKRPDGSRIEDLQQPVHSLPLSASDRRRPVDQPTISLPEKNCAISIAAVSAASEPCTEFSPIEFACSLRIVPAGALDGSVAPMTSRYFAMAPSPCRTCTTTGAEIMNSTNSPKNGRALCTA